MQHRELPAKEFDNSRSTLSAPTGGYACAFNSQGDLEIFMQATGEPGWHYIDLYPAIYKGKTHVRTIIASHNSTRTITPPRFSAVPLYLR
jgi:hypothetical protein